MYFGFRDGGSGSELSRLQGFGFKGRLKSLVQEPILFAWGFGFKGLGGFGWNLEV